MNNKTKGWIAAGLGGALLLGTGGTFALWSDSVELGASTVEAGALELKFADSSDKVNWVAVDDGGNSVPLGSGDVVLNPHITLVGTANVDVDLAGTWMVAKLIVTDEDGEPTEKPAWLDVTATFEDAAGDEIEADGTLTPGNSGTGTLKVEAKLAEGFTVTDVGTAGAEWNLTGAWEMPDLQITLKQVAPDFP